jgi:hypothetical protein
VIVKDVLPALDAIANELNDKAHLSLAQQRLGRAHDSKLAANLQPIANLERSSGRPRVRPLDSATAAGLAP